MDGLSNNGTMQSKWGVNISVEQGKAVQVLRTFFMHELVIEYGCSYAELVLSSMHFHEMLYLDLAKHQTNPRMMTPFAQLYICIFTNQVPLGTANQCMHPNLAEERRLHT
jgi:hypothetical protein